MSDSSSPNGTNLKSIISADDYADLDARYKAIFRERNEQKGRTRIEEDASKARSYPYGRGGESFGMGV